MQNEDYFRDNSLTVGLRAAQYVRMSTDNQKYSTTNQAEAIAAYADRRGIEIICNYADEGRSGLRLANRKALQDLLNDVRSGNSGFNTILVYDVSRWGRFQDVDESAYYEFICKQAGIQVHYCAEPFENDGSFASTMQKYMKRAMAGELSRELSTKVFIGQCRIASMGFFRGGFPSYGLRRQMLDGGITPKAILERGQRKSLQTDRVVLRPGPQEEVELVQRIFMSFVTEKKLGSEIAAELNAEQIISPYGKQWKGATIHKMLENETYLGHSIFNRTSFKLQQKHVNNPPEMWVRRDNAFEAIIAPKIFAKAQKILERRRYRMSDTEALERLAKLFRRKGGLSDKIINAAKDVPSSSTYIARFGSLAEAYNLVGHPFKRRRYRVETGPEITAVVDQAVRDLFTSVKRFGGRATYDEQTRLLTVNQYLKVAIRVARPTNGEGPRAQRWRLVKSQPPDSDLTIVIRLDDSKSEAQDYYLLPTRLLAQSKDHHLRLSKRIFREQYRYSSLERFYRICSRGGMDIDLD